MSKRSADYSDVSTQKRSRVSEDFSANGDPMYRRSSFGAHSPQGSPKGLSSAEVAADFKDDLQYLISNDRTQISNLTIIAKECTEHALAISRVLEDHIRKVAPIRKLPALYVLDSIVKNVGTPFTIYLGQNLYRTFMDAYTLVDPNTRKSMEAMLKTWKEPIPGSMENRPVFPIDVVKPIENALIKARTLFLQQQQEQARLRPMHALPPRPMSAQQDWARTGTPPQNQQLFAPPPQFDPRYGTPAAATPQYGIPPSPYLMPPPVATPQPGQGYPYPNPPPAMPAPQPQVPYSLAALLQAAGTFTPTPQGQPPPLPMMAPPPPTPSAQPPVQAATAGFAGLEALFGLPGFPQPGQPQPQFQQQPTPLPQYAAPNYTQPPAMPIPTPYTQLPALPSLASALALSAQTNISTPTLPFASLNKSSASLNDVQLSASSLKISRPYLLDALYNKLSSQCLTCGRRFGPDEVGRARKARHLDAHFRTNVRITDAQRRGISRSWYVDELDWIRSREVDDADEDIDTAAKGEGGAGVDAAAKVVADAGADIGGGGGGVGVASGTSGAGAKATKGEYYVPAPADAAVAAHACPICQEEFKTVWHDGAQEWVWMDAMAMAGKTYHASCVMDMAKDRGPDVKGEVKGER